MEISAWLRSLGLEQYQPAFRENDIDADVGVAHPRRGSRQSS